jgi:hypothetical protein
MDLNLRIDADVQRKLKDAMKRRSSEQLALTSQTERSSPVKDVLELGSAQNA